MTYALGNAACRQGFSAAYHRLPRLLEELRIAHGDGSFERAQPRIDVLILDDWAVAPIALAQRNDLLVVLDGRTSGRETIDAIAFVHFRDVVGNSFKFSESFWDEGKLDMVEAIRTYKRVGFTGYLTPDHHPHVIEDTAWGHRCRGVALGYMRGLIQSAAALRFGPR